MMYEPDAHAVADQDPQLALLDQDAEMDDLFGNDEDRGAASDAQSGVDSDRLPSPERERRQALEYEEDEEPGQIAVIVREANVAFPNIPVPKTSNGENWTLRTPNYVKVDSRPFHPETYVGPEEEEAQQGESLREKSMTIKLNVENTLRWRWVKDKNGVDRKQSNARIIRWSDGSLSLRLGKELFDIKMNRDTIRPPQPQSQSQSQSDSSSLKAQGSTYLVAQHRRAQVLQAETSISGYMTLQPTGMQSETHRMLVRSVGQKHNKVARLRMVDEPTVDPERQLQDLIKAEARKSKRRTNDASGKPRKSRRSRVKADIWSDEDDEGAAYQSEEEDERSPGTARRRTKHRHTEVHDEENRGGGNYQEDDFVVADSSEDEGGGGRRKRRRDDEIEEEDPLDRLDSKIEENERRESKHGAGGDESMDVESEEDDEFKVKRSGAGSRKKRTLNFDDEDADE